MLLAVVPSEPFWPRAFVVLTATVLCSAALAARVVLYICTPPSGISSCAPTPPAGGGGLRRAALETEVKS